MKPRLFREGDRQDVRDDDRYAFMFASIAAYLRQYMEMDCRALVLIAATADGHVQVMNGGKSIDFDFNRMLNELVNSGIDLNRPAEGGIN
jgi:hypothetical protein